MGNSLGLLMIIVGTVTLISSLRSQREMRAFSGSNYLIVGLLATASATIFPVMLYSTLAPENSLTAYTVASSRVHCFSPLFGGRWFLCWRPSISSLSHDGM